MSDAWWDVPKTLGAHKCDECQNLVLDLEAAYLHHETVILKYQSQEELLRAYERCLLIRFTFATQEERLRGWDFTPEGLIRNLTAIENHSKRWMRLLPSTLRRRRSKGLVLELKAKFKFRLLDSLEDQEASNEPENQEHEPSVDLCYIHLEWPGNTTSFPRPFLIHADWGISIPLLSFED